MENLLFGLGESSDEADMGLLLQMAANLKMVVVGAGTTHGAIGEPRLFRAGQYLMIDNTHVLRASKKAPGSAIHH